MPDSSWAVTLPSTQPSPGEVAQHGMDMRERQFERMASLQQQQQRQQQIDQRYQEGQRNQHLNSLQTQLDPTAHLTGIQKLDMISMRAISDLKNEMVERLNKGEDWGAIQSETHQRLTPIVTNDALAKSKYSEGTTQLKEYAAKNKNFDLSKATNDLLGQVGNMYVAPNEKGSFDFKPADQVNHDQDIVGNMLHPDNRWKYAVNEQPLIKDLQDPKGDDWSAFHKNGNGEITEYKSKIPIWHDAPQRDATGYVKGVPSFQLKTEKIDSRDSQGRPVKIEYIGDDMRHNILDTDEKQDAFNLMWNQRKQQMGWGNLPAKEERIRSGEFLANLIKQNDHNQPQPMHIQQPQKWQIYPNGTGGSKGKGSNEPPTIKDVFGGISTALDGSPDGKIKAIDLTPDQREAVLKHARTFSGIGTIDGNELIVKKDANGKPRIFKVSPKTQHELEDLGSIDFGINAKVNRKDKQTTTYINKKQAEQQGQSIAPKATKTKGSAGIQWATH